MRFTPLGDAAVRIAFGEAVVPDVHRRVRACCAALERADLPGVRAWVPSYAAVTVFYQPHAVRYPEMVARLEALGSSAAPPPPAELFTLPVLYDGPDLPFVAERAGLSTSDAAALHAAPTYLVYMIGFMPGFPYLGGLPARLEAPRLDSPRRSVPAGSVGIGGGQTGVYPLESPGGWRLIGRTPVRLYDPAGSPGVLLRAGDRLRFRPVGAEEHREIVARVERGSYEVDRRPFEEPA